MKPADQSSFVEVQLPPQLFGGDPRGLIEQHLGLLGRHLGGDRWAVRPNDEHGLIKSYDLADETGLAHHFDRLNHAPEAPSFSNDPELVQRFHELESQLVERMTGGGGDPSALFHLIQANVVRASREDVVAAVKDGYDGIGQMPMAETGEPAFTNRSAHLVVATELLIRRVRLPAIMFRFDQDPDAMQTLTAQLQDPSSGGYFSSSTDWYHDIIGVVHYLGPLLGCLGPRFWGFPANRPLATILFSLGMHINGFRNSPMEPMQLLPMPGRDEPIPSMQLNPASCRQAIHWWVFRLNQMFGYLSDPTTFKDAQGIYAPHEHHHWMLTFGQLFGLTTSLQTAGRDRTAQRALMNTLLDAYADRILDRDFERLCTFEFAKSTADQVRQRMPPDVAAMLMPAADRAVSALAQVQDGFFIQQQRGDEDVRFRLPDGSWEQRSPERATALLLKVFRNATHGFGHRKGARRKNEIAASLLVHHNGDLPVDVVLLPYLYLLDTLCNPDRVREMIARKVAIPD